MLLATTQFLYRLKILLGKKQMIVEEASSTIDDTNTGVLLTTITLEYTCPKQGPLLVVGG
jgi:hypothetical protein